MLRNATIKEWRLVNKIGEGAFGEIYSARNTETNELGAIKLERADSKKQVLKLEVSVLKKLQPCVYVCRLRTWGRHQDWNYMVMDLCGENLSELRKYQGGKFELITTLQIGIQLLDILQDIHAKGYIHRDIKPSNFVIGLSQDKRRNIYLIDFGLARRYTNTDGALRPERPFAGFRGTARYASVNSHQSRDLSRRDDVWSILFILVEFATGSLPWRKLRDKDKIGEMKAQGVGPDLVAGLPPQFLAFLDHLQTLTYSDQPNYAYLKKLLNQALTACSGGTINKAYPWENASAPLRLHAGTYANHTQDSKHAVVHTSGYGDSSTNSSATPNKEQSTGPSSVPSGSTDSRPADPRPSDTKPVDIKSNTNTIIYTSVEGTINGITNSSNSTSNGTIKYRLVKANPNQDGRAYSVAPISLHKLNPGSSPLMTNVDLEASEVKELGPVDLENSRASKPEIEPIDTQNEIQTNTREPPNVRNSRTCNCKCCTIL